MRTFCLALLGTFAVSGCSGTSGDYESAVRCSAVVAVSAKLASEMGRADLVDDVTQISAKLLERAHYLGKAAGKTAGEVDAQTELEASRIALDLLNDANDGTADVSKLGHELKECAAQL